MRLARRMTRRRGQIDIFGAGRRAAPEAMHPAPAEPWLPAERLHREFQASASISRPIRSTNTRADAGKDARAELGRVLRRREARRDRRPAGRNGHVQAGAQDRTGNKMGVVNFPTRPASTRPCCSPKTLAQYRDLLEPANRWSSRRGRRPPGRRQPAHQTVQSLEEEASRVQKALRVFLRDAGSRSTSLSSQLTTARRGAGEPRRAQGRRPGRGRDRTAAPTAM
jgi:DNA polymerase-3 subunit alpha